MRGERERLWEEEVVRIDYNIISQLMNDCKQHLTGTNISNITAAGVI